MIFPFITQYKKLKRYGLEIIEDYLGINFVLCPKSYLLTSYVKIVDYLVN